MTKEELFAIMKGTIIVSCQATPGEPLYDPVRSVMPLMARAAKQAGAKMIRTSSVRDIIGIKEETGLPVIGLIKREYPGYTGRITMTMREVDECMEALADIVSIDCTDTARGDGLSAPEFLREVKKKYPNIIIMADCATLEEAKAAVQAGADLAGSTMNGYTAATAHCTGEPNYELVEQMVKELPCPVIAEGRVHTPEQARKMLDLGAWAVVVGGAITRPLEIAQRFMAVVQ
ncbi:MAG: N-acetylmannosamine-6-phosphate 2-epimerase [Clostridia bacterium]|jgi:N-acylglucosamine-6-phosphate 2-epimerase|nr:N-acetylmannosamine-6-phosphate 2-epimerase [Clostridia bacterium]